MPATRSSRPPGPRGLEVLGFFGDGTFGGTLRFLESQARRHGPIVAFGIGARTLYLLDDPELVRQVLVVQQHRFARSTGAALLREIVGVSLVTAEEPIHRARRRMMQPAFGRARILEYAAVAAEEARALAAAWRAGRLVDAGAAMARITLAIAGRTLFGADVGGRAEAMTAALAPALRTISALGPLLEALPPWVGGVRRRLPLASNARFAAARRALEAILGEAIARRRAAPDGRDDLLSLILAARDTDGTTFDDRAVADELATLLLAGHETTATALTWTWYLLAQSPAVEARLHAEVDALGRDPEPADLEENLTYANAVFAEALRIYPPASAFGRRALEVCRLGGFEIERGAGIVISPYVSHRNPAWFPEPERFAPERWERPAWPEFAYVPFGGGARRCIGDAFARAEAVLVLATLARRFRLRRIEHDAVAIATATLRPRRPIVVRLEARGAQ